MCMSTQNQDPGTEEAVTPTSEGENLPATQAEENPAPAVDSPYTLHPLELPANPIAAALYPNQEIIDPDKPMSEERQAQAKEAIQAEKDKMESSVVIDDQRLEGGGVTVTPVVPEEAVATQEGVATQEAVEPEGDPTVVGHLADDTVVAPETPAKKS